MYTLLFIRFFLFFIITTITIHFLTIGYKTNGRLLLSNLTQLYVLCVSVFRLSCICVEIGQEQLLNSICFESMTTLDVECFFKGMRADHDMPTMIGYAYRRARCVEDDMLRIYQKHQGPILITLKKSLKVIPRNITSRATSRQESAKERATKKKITGEKTR